MKDYVKGVIALLNRPYEELEEIGQAIQEHNLRGKLAVLKRAATPKRAGQQAHPPSGVYETTYGNAAAYKTRRSTAWDLDMAERISLDSVDFTKFIRKLDDFDKEKA